MARIQSYRELIVWQRAMELAEECYRLAGSLPESERFGLSPQLRRAVVSIASNIAEGFNRRSRRAYLNHLSIAAGSHAEVDTQLELCSRVGMIGTPDLARAGVLSADVGRLLHALIRALESADAR